MKIVIINGSPRERGLTSEILHIIENRLINKGAEVAFYNLGELNIKQCSGCCSCYTTGKCIFNDDAENLSLEIADADGIVIGSPTYASNISGLLKKFVDRGHFVIEQLLFNKYAVSVTTGENYGSKDANKILNKLLSYSGAKISRKLVLNAPFNSTFCDEKRASDIADKLYKDIIINNAYLFQKIKHRIIFSMGIKPFVQKKGKKYQGVTNRWKKTGII